MLESGPKMSLLNHSQPYLHFNTSPMNKNKKHSDRAASRPPLVFSCLGGCGSPLGEPASPDSTHRETRLGGGPVGAGSKIPMFGKCIIENPRPPG